MNKETNKTSEVLARIVKKGFDGVGLQIADVKIQIADLKSEHGKRFDILEKKVDQTWGLIGD